MGFAYCLSLFDPTDEPCNGLDTRRLNDVGQVKTLLGILGKTRPAS
jgi:hypothetical protein